MYISIVLFIIGVIFGYVHGTTMWGLMENSTMATSALNSTFNDFLSIFTHNVLIDWAVVLTGFLFSIYGFIITIFNGCLIGGVLKVATPLQFIVGIVPHGIFEIPSSVIAMVGSLIATTWEIKMIKAFLSKNKDIHEEYSKNKYMLKDIVATILYIFILLVIAGIIESTITPYLLSFV